MAYTTLLFDFDHTLFDSDVSESDAFEASLRAHGVADPRSLIDRYRIINRRLWTDVERGAILPEVVRTERFRQLTAQTGLDVNPHSVAQTFVEQLGERGDLYPGARKTLEALAGLSSLALVTNGLGEVQRRRVERLGIADLFDAIVISGEVGAAKPGTAIFDITFDQLGEPPRSTVLMIGDSLTSDMAGGANYGIDTCWISPDGRVAPPSVTHTVESLAAVHDIVEPSGRDG